MSKARGRFSGRAMSWHDGLFGRRGTTMHATLVCRMLIAAIVASALAARAQDYPNKPIRIVVPYVSGGGVDITARIVADKLREKWGQPAIVENRSGGGGNVGTEHVVKSSPDGYTLLFGAPGPIVINKSLYRKLAFDPDTLVPVSVVVTHTNMLAARPGLAVESVQQLIAFARANPGRINYATQGVGSISHITSEMFQSVTGIRMVHVPYKGAAAAIADLLGGQVDMGFLELSVVLPHVRAGKLRALAVGDEKRNPLLPDTPAMTEVVPGLVFASWYGVLAPPKTQPAIASKLSVAIAEILKQPEVAKQIRDRNAEVAGSTPEEMALLLRRERERWSNVIRAAGITAE